MSFLEATVEPLAGGRIAVRVPGMTGGVIELQPATDAAVPSEAVLGLRPEHFNSTRASGPKLVADIEFIERLGGESYLHAPSHPGGGLIMRRGERTRYFRRRRPPASALTVAGAAVRARWHLDTAAANQLSGLGLRLPRRPDRPLN